MARYPTSVARCTQRALLTATLAAAVAAPASGAVAFLSQTCKTQTFALLGVFSMNAPAGVASGDLLIATMRVSSLLSFGFAPPADWSELASASDDNAKVYVRVAGAAEPASYAFGNILSVGATMAGTLVAFSGADPAAPIAAAARATGSGTTVALPTLTATRNGSVRYANVTTGTGADASFPAQTEACDVSSGGVSVAGGYASVAAADRSALAASLSLSTAWIGQSMLVQPPSPCTNGSLLMGAPSTVSFPATVLDGTDRTVATTATIGVSDMTDSAAGWNLTATSTRFTSGGDTLADRATTITGVSLAAGATNCGPATSTTTFPILLPAGPTAPPATKIFSAAAGSGLGQSNLTFAFALALPGDARAGTYTSTWTFTVASGP